jgi:hypothetical protein
MTTALRLGPLPKMATVKINLALPAALKADLDRYAQLHSQTWGEPTDVLELIPHMLEAFMARDRGFRKARRPNRHARTSPLQDR